MNGDVIVHESAIVAPGAILKAAPDSRIVIGAGACVGMGTILNAYQGVISVGAGAILGTGVLIVGRSEIGQNACIGSTTTIYNASIDPDSIVPSGSLIGDTSRQVTIEVSAIREPEPVAPEPEPIAEEDFWEEETPAAPEPETPSEVPPFVQPEAVTVREASTVKETSTVKESPPDQPVVGKVYINQLLFTLFPERRHFNGAHQNGSG